jgi:hypothetical protein
VPCDYTDGAPVLRGEFDKGGLAQRLALIRYYFKEVPKSLDDISIMWGQLVFALQFDGKLKMKEPKKG